MANNDIAVYNDTVSLIQLPIFEPLDMKVPCGGFKLLGGGVIGKSFFNINNEMQVSVSVDDSVYVDIGATKMKGYPAKKINVMYMNDKHRNALRFGLDENFNYHSINEDGIVLNAISYMNVLGSLLGVKCVGMTDPLKPDDRSEKVVIYKAIWRTLNDLSQDVVFVVYVGDPAPIKIDNVVLQLGTTQPVIREGINLILTLDGAYVVEQASETE